MLEADALEGCGRRYCSLLGAGCPAAVRAMFPRSPASAIEASERERVATRIIERRLFIEVLPSWFFNCKTNAGSDAFATHQQTVCFKQVQIRPLRFSSGKGKGVIGATQKRVRTSGGEPLRMLSRCRNLRHQVIIGPFQWAPFQWA